MYALPIGGGILNMRGRHELGPNHGRPAHWARAQQHICYLQSGHVLAKISGFVDFQESNTIIHPGIPKTDVFSRSAEQPLFSQGI